MADLAGTKTAIRTWIAGNATGVDADSVIFGNQNAPRPAVPYITVVISTNTQIGHADNLPQAAVDDDQKGRIQRVFSVSIQGFGEGADQALENVRNSIENPDIRAAIAEDGITIADITDVRDIAALIDSRVEPRFLMEATVHSAVEPVYTGIGTIGTVEGQGEFETPAETVAEPINVTT